MSLFWSLTSALQNKTGNFLLFQLNIFVCQNFCVSLLFVDSKQHDFTGTHPTLLEEKVLLYIEP